MTCNLTTNTITMHCLNLLRNHSHTVYFFFYNFALLDWYDTDKTQHYILDFGFCKIPTLMTLNLACAYAQFLARLCIKSNMYLKDILDSFNEFSRYHMVR